LRLLITHSPDDLLPSIYLLSNHLSPSYIPLELGVGFQILNKAITEVSGVNREGLKRLWDRFGDPGDVAYEAKVRSRTPWYLFVSLTVGCASPISGHLFDRRRYLLTSCMRS
jgi:hypothetical protein